MRNQFMLLAGTLCLLVILAGGCIFSSDDGDDGNGNSTIPEEPAVSSLNLADGQVLTENTYLVTWEGNEAADLFQYTIDGDSSAWRDSSYAWLRNLSDGEHTFSVTAKNDSLTSEPLSVSFTVDAFTGPGITFTPSTISTISYVECVLADVEGVMAVHIEIVCDAAAARLTEFTPAASLPGNPTIVAFSDETGKNRLVIDMGFAGLPEGLSGSHAIGTFIVSPTATTGTIRVDADNTFFRDGENAPIDINSFGEVTILK